MSKKSEIKVYLPTKMIGELESRKRAGIRSKFIEKAIRKSLDDDGNYHIDEEDFMTVIDECVVRMRGLRIRNEKEFNSELANLIWRFLR